MSYSLFGEVGQMHLLQCKIADYLIVKYNAGVDVPQPNWHYKSASLFGDLGQVHCEIAIELSRCSPA